MIVRTADLGKTWQSIVGEGLPPNDPVEVVREDPVNTNLFYAGTHFGLYRFIRSRNTLDPTWQCAAGAR